MKKHRISALSTAFLILSGVCGIVPQAGILSSPALTAFAESDGETAYKQYEDFLYEEYDDFVRLKKYTGKDETVVIPGEIGNKKVEQLDSDLFPDKKLIKKAVLPDSFTWGPLDCFKDCVCLESVQLPDELQFLGDSAFSGCISLKEINLPNALNYIDSCAFKNCKSLEEITLPPSACTISDCAFEGCEKLKTITFSCRMEGILYHAFYGTAWLKEQQKKNPIVCIDGLVIDGSTCTGTVRIPKGVTAIAERI